MRVLPVLLIATFASPAVATPSPKPAPAAPAAAPAKPLPAVAPTWDDAKVIEQSQKFQAAVDTYDFTAYSKLADPKIVAYYFGRTYSLDEMKRELGLLTDNHIPAQTRVCKNPRVKRSDTSIIYVDYCEITLTAHDDVPSLTVSKSTSLIWNLHDGDWKVVYSAENLTGLESERENWNETFHSPVFFKTTANQHLIDTVKGRKPGKALDVAMGQGRNALYLASQGWKVTGVDISDEGMKIAQANAAKQKLKLETINHDAETFDYGKDKWDLVTLIYAGNNHAEIEKIKPSIKKGGLFVVEFFAKESTAKTGIGGFEPGELKALFDDGKWTIVKDEVVEDIADWGLGKTKLVRFTAQKK